MDELRSELRALCFRRNLSGEAAAELHRLLAWGTEAELRDAIWHLRSMSKAGAQ